MEVDTIAIHMPEENFEKLLDFLGFEDIEELRLRKTHPAVQKAWAQYVTIINLLGVGKTL
jgi:hypothetical protein